MTLTALAKLSGGGIQDSIIRALRILILMVRSVHPYRRETYPTGVTLFPKRKDDWELKMLTSALHSVSNMAFILSVVHAAVFGGAHITVARTLEAFHGCRARIEEPDGPLIDRLRPMPVEQIQVRTRRIVSGVVAVGKANVWRGDMHYDIRENANGSWEVFRADTGEIAKLGGVRMKGLEHEEALSALHMLTSRFQGTERKKQAKRR